jgi:predicted DNA-binding transcriptional regulator AlpA
MTILAQPTKQVTAELPALLTKALITRHVLPISIRALDRWISSGQFPPADMAIGNKARYWRRETVENWITENMNH